MDYSNGCSRLVHAFVLSSSLSSQGVATEVGLCHRFVYHLLDDILLPRFGLSMYSRIFLLEPFEPYRNVHRASRLLLRKRHDEHGNSLRGTSSTDACLVEAPDLCCQENGPHRSLCYRTIVSSTKAVRG